VPGRASTRFLVPMSPCGIGLSRYNPAILIGGLWRTLRVVWGFPGIGFLVQVFAVPHLAYTGTPVLLQSFFHPSNFAQLISSSFPSFAPGWWR